MSGVSRVSGWLTVTVMGWPAVAGGLAGSHPPVAAGVAVTLKGLPAPPASLRALQATLAGSLQRPEPSSSSRPGCSWA